MITDRDIAIRAVADGLDVAEARVDQTMTPEVIYCYEDQEVDEAAKLMKDRQVRRLVVLNRDKRLTGILSLGDVAVDTLDDRLAGNTLEGISEPAAPRR
jgi:CBS domain-containing protein